MIKRALISTYDKNGVVDFAKYLEENNVEIISTGGTAKLLSENGIKVTKVSDVTKFPEIFNGRVKTLHPKIHGGILARKGKDEEEMKANKIEKIDLVFVNLYPFFEKVNEEIDFEKLLEFIDIGGPTMIRSAAKNLKDVVILTDNNDIELIKEKNLNIDFQTRKKLALKAFNLTSAYDASISEYLAKETGTDFPEYHTVSYKKYSDLRYGENPHQKAAFYVKNNGKYSYNDFEQLHGKELSYNNLRDADIAWKVVNEFEDIACCGLKHNTPCGVGVAETVEQAYQKAYEGDPISIFGGIVSFNRTVDKATALKLKEIFLEIVIAPDFDDEALEVLKKKKNLRLLKMKKNKFDDFESITIDGGILVQNTDKEFINKFEVVTKNKNISEKMKKELEFAYKVVKYSKSNAIAVTANKKLLGVGNGEANRIWAAEQALERAKGKGAVLASDAFFPFDDVVKLAAKYNIKAIIQPGGSIRDKDSIKACDENGITMVFTGMRHFKH
jgi:phosphoribosylaminoimidazolecarboxamide formyltransferase/IMP cyclohydrolase